MRAINRCLVTHTRLAGAVGGRWATDGTGIGVAWREARSYQVPHRVRNQPALMVPGAQVLGTLHGGVACLSSE